MTKYVRVDQLPDSLDRECYVIKAPNFLDEIKSCDSKKPKNGLLTTNYLREVFAAIAVKYADANFNVLTDVDVSRYRGVPFNTPEDVNAVVKKAIDRDCKFIFDNYVEYHLKKRPAGTKLVYFLGSHLQSGPFFRHGVDEIKLKDVDVYLGKKAKKIVGKPAITNEEAAQSNDQ